jgi:hypothetical protein
MSSNSSARSTTPEPSPEVILARAMLRATLEQGWAPTRKNNRTNLPLSTVPSVLTRRLPSGGLAHGMFPSKEAQRQTLFELHMLTAHEETEFDEEPAPKRLKKEGPP